MSKGKTRGFPENLKVEAKTCPARVPVSGFAKFRRQLALSKDGSHIGNCSLLSANVHDVAVFNGQGRSFLKRPTKKKGKVLS